MYEVGLTAPQIELSNGTIAMFWYADLEIEANNKKEARLKAKKQDWYDASPDGSTLDHGVKKVLRINNI